MYKKKFSKHIFIWLYFHLRAGNLWQSDHWVLETWLEWLYSARFVCSRHAWDYEHCGVDFHCQGDNGQRDEPLGITWPQPQLRLVEIFSMIMICGILKVVMVHDRTENRARKVPPVVPYKALGKFPKALYGRTGGTCSAWFFRPVVGGLYRSLGLMNYRLPYEDDDDYDNCEGFKKKIVSYRGCLTVSLIWLIDNV